LRDANQPFFPQNAVVNPGTVVTWFNVDVGHLHEIKLVDSSKHVPYDSGTFPNFAASKPVKLNNTGTYIFSEAGLDKKYPNFVLNGTLTVPNQLPPVSSTNGTSLANNINTVIPFMVPTNQQEKLISDLKTLGFGVDNLYTFKTPRGVASGEGCGDKNQSLLILTSSDSDPNGIITRLKQISPTLPCT